MFSGCAATGRNYHVFDADTHRCRCGRWKAGYKPKAEPVRPRHECQICERVQAVDVAGKLGHHGYKRPGFGFIQGDCMGVNHKPYPATDALELYLGAVDRHLAVCQKSLAELPAVEFLTHFYTVRSGREREQKTHVVPRGTEAEYRGPVPHPGFEFLEKMEARRLTAEIENMKAEVVRVRARIDNAAK